MWNANSNRTRLTKRWILPAVSFSHKTNQRLFFAKLTAPCVTAGEIQNFRRVKNYSCSPHSQFIIMHIYTNTARRQLLEEYNFCGGIQTIREENRRKIKNDCSRYRKLKNSSSRLLSLTLSLPSLITANLQWEVRHPSESQGLRLLLLTLGEQNTPQEP